MKQIIAILLFFSLTFPAFALDTTFFPSADGYVAYGPVGTWSVVRTSAGTGVDDTTASLSVPYIFGETPDPSWSTMRRGLFVFDTSSLGAGSTVSSSTFSINVTAKTDNATLNQSLSIVGASSTNNTSLVVADYAQNASTTQRYALDVDLGSVTTGGYWHSTLNSDGIANISLTGFTKIGAKFNGDASNTAPTWIASNSLLTVDMVETAGTASDPKLVVTYTAAVTTAKQEDILIFGF